MNKFAGVSKKAIVYWNFILCFPILIKRNTTTSDFMKFQESNGKSLVNH